MEKNKYGLHWIYQKTKGCRLQLAVYALLALCIPVIQLLFAYFMKLFIDIATGSIHMPLLDVGFCSIAAIAVGGILMMINSVLVKWISGKMECNLRAELMDVIFSRRMLDLSKQHTGELLTRLTADVQAVSTCAATLIDQMVGGAASALLATVALFFLNWKIAAILLVLTPLLLFLTGALTPYIQRASVSDQGNDEINRSVMQENLSRILLIKTYFMRGKAVERIRSTYQNKLKSAMKLGLWEGLALFAGAIFGNSMSLVTLGLGAYFVLKGETTVGSLIMIVQLLNYIVTPVAKFSAAVAEVGKAVASSGRIGMIYEIAAEKKVPTAPVHATELVVKDLCFSYGGEDGDSEQSFLLDNISMSFSKGEVTGIVGKSGSGKSTLLKLLIGLYAAQAGTVELKHTLGTLSGEQIMPQVGYVPPDGYLFSGNVSDNIIMAEREPRYDEMRMAASGANIEQFVQSLPSGFDTLLGESGGTVSSGQAGRIAIARALYKKAPLLVFDEPTANLDADSIEKFRSTVKNLAKDKICIIVTHDAAALAGCDKVYELEHGSIREKHLTEKR